MGGASACAPLGPTGRHPVQLESCGASEGFAVIDTEGEELRANCLAIYTAEKAEGTDMPPIVGLLQEHVEREEERLRLGHDQRWRKRAEDDRIALK